ncbi:hypothetical protein NQ317_005999 [Molorchus minor]|uniref:Major facilitator superfamily (MFS) profile domain-containing protein n=1 Tax=Molorchus minor TaxID=1323400 RepID=A0ABQ9J2X5_9CUCU|nr:hypothetical protein NQ317_005999 [Molorchus minor]
MVVDGIIFSFGTFLANIADDFNVNKAQVTLVGSLMSGFYLMVGPFVSAIANRYGFRLVAILGSFMGAAAFAISYFATSVTFLCISYGLLGGIGFGFIYVPSVITIGFYLKMASTCNWNRRLRIWIGTFLFAPLTEILITKLGWKSALLCQGALVLTCVLYGALYRPLKPVKVKELKDNEIVKELVMDPSKLPSAARMKMEEAEVVWKKARHSFHGSHSSICRMFGQEKLRRKEKQNLIDIDKLNPIIIPKRTKTVSESHETSDINRPLYRDDIFFGASLTRLPQYTSRTSVAYNMSVTRLPTKNDIRRRKETLVQIVP